MPTRRDRTTLETRKETWDNLQYALEDLEACSLTPADVFDQVELSKFEHSRADHQNSPPHIQDFMDCLWDFQDAMRYTYINPTGDRICELQPHLHNERAFPRDRGPMHQMDAMREQIKHVLQSRFVAPTTPDKPSFLASLRADTAVLPQLFETGQTVRDMLDEGVNRLMDCCEVRATYRPLGIVTFSSQYYGAPEQCCICLEATGARDAVAVNCAHVFHSACLRMLVNEAGNFSNLYPLCRRELYDRSARRPGPDEDVFDQREAVVAMHGLYRARLDLAHLKGLYTFIFGTRPPRDWLRWEDAWQVWPKGKDEVVDAIMGWGEADEDKSMEDEEIEEGEDEKLEDDEGEEGEDERMEDEEGDESEDERMEDEEVEEREDEEEPDDSGSEYDPYTDRCGTPWGC